MGEHFAAAPAWEWWILAYFFFGGLAGGSYALGTIIRLFGAPADQRAARIAYVTSFIALVPCPVFLTLDLGQPIRFWHMLVNTSEGGLMLKTWSPMSVGSWALLVFGLFSFVSFLGALAEGGRRALDPFARFLRGAAGTVWSVAGTVLALFVAGYTGVLLSVSNQAVWSDAGWALGGMFLASALAGSTALLLLLLAWRRADEAGTVARLALADRNFAIVEALLIVLFLVLLAAAGGVGRVLGVWLVLWAVVALGVLASLVLPRVRGLSPVASPIIALLGVLALRALVIFAAQF